MARFHGPLAWVLGIGLLAGGWIGTGCSPKTTSSGGSGGSQGGSGGSGGSVGSGGSAGSQGGSAGSQGGSGGSSGSGGSGGSVGQSGGSGTGGKAGSGGAGGAGGTLGAGGAGGTLGAGGTGGTSEAGGAGGTSGAGGAGGGSGTGTTAVSCESTTPASVVKATSVAISNFTPPDSSGTLAPAGVDATGSIGTAVWPYAQPVGNTYVYPAKTSGQAGDGGACTNTGAASALTSSLNECDGQPTPGVWTIKGTVGTWSGAGISFWCPVDASAYSGVQFDVGGDVGPSGTITFGITFCSDATLTTCQNGEKSITVTSTTTTVSVLWSELAVTLADGGAGPQFASTVITGISWAFGWYWPEDAGAPYDLNVTLDNLAWLP